MAQVVTPSPLALVLAVALTLLLDEAHARDVKFTHEGQRYSVEVMLEPSGDFVVPRGFRLVPAPPLDGRALRCFVPVTMPPGVAPPPPPLSPMTPAVVAHEETEDEAIVNTLALLEPLSGRCMVHSEGWWSYRFCFGGLLSQFHGTDVTHSLGSYDDAATRELARVHFRARVGGRRPRAALVSQVYNGGAVCDETRAPRTTTVVFVCASKTRFRALEELSICSYRLTIETHFVCTPAESAQGVVVPDTPAPTGAISLRCFLGPAAGLAA